VSLPLDFFGGCEARTVGLCRDGFYEKRAERQGVRCRCDQPSGHVGAHVCGWCKVPWRREARAAVDPGPPNPEMDIRDDIIEDLAMRRSDYLRRIRRAMVELYEKRATRMAVAYVTADDARRAFESWNPPEPEKLSRNFLGAVFKTSDWEPIGQYHSRTEGSHANRLVRWRLWAQAGIGGRGHG